MKAKLEKLHAELRAHAPLLIAYSGGVDSAYLLAEAQRVLGDRVLGVIADSASLPREALSEALALAAQIGAKVEVVQTGELADPNYASNPLNRCYFCKAELFSALEKIAAARGFAAIAYGENADDARQVRPGRKAAAEFSVLAPLRTADLSKTEIRALSRALDLPTADAPAQPCLSSRIPHGTPVTIEALRLIEEGEVAVRALGFRIFRVRYLSENRADAEPSTESVPRARLQVAPEDLARAEETFPAIRVALLKVGFSDAELDPAGYRAPAESSSALAKVDV